MSRWISVLLCSIWGCVAVGERTPTEIPFSDLKKELDQKSDEGFDGGLTHAEVDLAEALARAAWASGIPRAKCIKEVYSNTNSKYHLSRIEGNEVLHLLEESIARRNRRQRAIALLAVARIGPGGAFNRSFLKRPSGWANNVLSEAFCVHREQGLAFYPYSDYVTSITSSATAVRFVDDQVERMLDKRFVYPVEFFNSAFNVAYKNSLASDMARRLMPILLDASYDRSIREEVLIVSQFLEVPLEIVEDPLLLVYRHDPVFAPLAGRALIRRGSVHAADIAADIITSEPETWHDNRRFGLWFDNCDGRGGNDRLSDALVRATKGEDHRTRFWAIRLIGCTGTERAMPRLVELLDTPFWELNLEVIDVMERLPVLPASARDALQRIASSHWSALVRKNAAWVLSNPGKPKTHHVTIFLHRTSISQHELPLCHGEQPGDGPYRLPWLGVFEVQWTDAKVHDLPPGFPIEIYEMRYHKDYGSNTFFRVEDGWLFGTDLWHYGGQLGFVTDDRVLQELDSTAEFIIKTQFGITLLHSDLLAVLERKRDGTWSYRDILGLPSDAFGFSFAPDGTLLVRDDHGAVAITKERKIFPLECG